MTASEPRPSTGPATGSAPGPADGAGATWWASDADRVDPDQDPLATHLAARGLHAVGPDDRDPADDDLSSDPDDGPAGERPDRDPPGPAPHAEGICGVCPICRGYTTLEQRHPEVAGHLADAARSLSLALAHLADAMDAGTPRSGRESADDDAGAFRPIKLDDDEGDRP